MSQSAAFSVESIVEQLLFLDGGKAFVNGSFWTLFVEFRWYLAFPVLLWLWIRSPKAFVVTGATLLVAWQLTRVDAIDVDTLPAFMLGMLAAHLQLRPHRASKYAVVLAVAGTAVGLAETRAWNSFMTFPTEVAAFGLFVYAGHVSVARTVLQSTILSAIGRCSYSIYLVHEPVVGIVNRLFSGALPPAALIPLAALAGVAAGFAFSQVFEQPLLHGRLRRRALDALEPAIRRLWTSMPGERGIALSVPAARSEPIEIAV